MKQRGVIITLVVVSLLLITFGTTYSWLTWSSKNDSVLNITIGNIVNYEYKVNNKINVNSLAPVLSYEDGELLEFSLSKYEFDNSKVNIYLYINNIDDELKNKSFKYILLKERDNNNYGIAAMGDFMDSSSNSKYYILENEDVSLEKTNYRLYIYIDGNMENDNNMMNKNFNALMNVEIRRED